eukprot:SAG31_NODE_3342_length_4383_cov_5.306723_5_plen_180_part_00
MRVCSGVFGRCIAGQGFGGNFGYFKSIIGLGTTGVFSAVVAGMAGLVLSTMFSCFVASITFSTTFVSNSLQTNAYGWAGAGYATAIVVILWICGISRMIICSPARLCDTLLVCCGCRKSRKQLLREAHAAQREAATRVQMPPPAILDPSESSRRGQTTTRVASVGVVASKTNTHADAGV